MIRAILQAQIIMPWNNLGCLGFSIPGIFYGDIFMHPYFGIYWSWRGVHHRINIRRRSHRRWV